MIKLKIISLSDRLHLYFILVVLLLVAILINYFIFLVVFLFLIYFWKFFDKVIVFLLIIVTTLSGYVVKSRKIPDNIKGEFLIKEVISLEYSNKYVISKNGVNYVFTSSLKYTTGDVLYIEGRTILFNEETVPNGFNEKKYNLGKSIYAKIKVDKVEYIKHKFDKKIIANTINESIKNKFSYKIYSYVTLFLTGTNVFENEYNDELRFLGIYNLLILSGINIIILITLLKKLFFYLDITNNKQDVVIIIFLIVIYLIQPSISVIRIMIVYLFLIINKKLDTEFTKLDALSLFGIMTLIISPNLLYNISYLMMLIAIFGINVIVIKHRIFRSLIFYIVAFPFLIGITNEIGINIIMTPIFALITQIIIFPSTLIAVFIPFLHMPIESILTIFEVLVKFISRISLKIDYPTIMKFASIYYIILIYLLLYKTKKQLITRTIILVMFLVVINIKITFSQSDSIYFLDVDQGDTTIIRRKHNKANIMIDAHKYTYKFLKSNGIKRIDYLFLTHSDLDHVKEAQSIIDNINVKNVVLSKYDLNYKIRHENIIYAKMNDQLKCGDLEFNILSPKKAYTSANNNSLVIKVKINDRYFLFMGDAEKEAETDMLLHENKLKSDVLKVGHHGSNTSTTINFLEKVNPNYAVISAGRDNKFGLPNKNIVERINEKGIKLYITALSGTIIFEYSSERKWIIRVSIYT